MKILITGGAGFVGSALAIQIKTNYSTYEVICLDNLKRKGSELNLPRLAKVGATFVHGDIRNKEDFDALPIVDFVIEASAEPSVLAGLNGTPKAVPGTATAPRARRAQMSMHWCSSPSALITSSSYLIAPLLFI